MSATQRGRVRNTFDDYPTSRWVVKRFLEKCKLPSGAWIEPSCGFGNLVRAIRQIRPDVDIFANDVQPENYHRIVRTTGLPPERISIADARNLDSSWLRDHFRVFITNPPFDIATEILNKGMEARLITVLLLRSAFLSSEERNAWLSKHVPDNYILPNRPKFLVGADEKEWKWNAKKGVWQLKKKGGDATDYSWLVWYPDERFEGKTVILDTTPLAERRADHEEMRSLAA